MDGWTDGLMDGTITQYTYVCKHIYIYKNFLPVIYIYIYICVLHSHTHIHTHTRTHTHTYIYIYIYTYTKGSMINQEGCLATIAQLDIFHCQVNESEVRCPMMHCGSSPTKHANMAMTHSPLQKN